MQYPGRYTGRSMNNEGAEALPRMRQGGGRADREQAARFPFRVQCRGCGWSTDAVKLEAVAVKLWNETKRQSKAKGRPK